MENIKIEITQAEATEIRRQEVSRGGLSYEVILAEPAPNVTVPKLPVTPSKSVSVEDIQQKLKAAEERRMSLEQKKIADIANELAKIEETSRKKDEMANEFIAQTKEQLKAKMEQVIEKRQAIINEIKEKMKLHAPDIEKTRELWEQQKYLELLAIQEKLKSAKFLRDENANRMLYRLKKHNNVKVAEIKFLKDRLDAQKIEEKALLIETKLYAAERNRQKELQKKIAKAQELERHAERVRQNKAAADAARKLLESKQN